MRERRGHRHPAGQLAAQENCRFRDQHCRGRAVHAADTGARKVEPGRDSWPWRERCPAPAPAGDEGDLGRQAYPGDGDWNIEMQSISANIPINFYI